MQVGPEHSTIDVLNHLQQMMMVAPIDADKNEAEDVAKKHRGQRPQRRKAGAERHTQLEHHDRDDDCDHAVTECFEAVASHDLANLNTVDRVAKSTSLESMVCLPISSRQFICQPDLIFLQ